MVSGRNHTVDIKNLDYHKQKKFFRLDREFDQNLVEQHRRKLKNTTDKAQQALLANLKREQLRLFRQYISEQKEKNTEINKTLMTSKIPKIEEALIGISEQSYASGHKSNWL
jgi:serine phosphatase RsbU (regulator of sigma subunit)